MKQSNRPKGKIRSITRPVSKSTKSKIRELPIFKPKMPTPKHNPKPFLLPLFITAFMFILGTSDFDTFVVLKDDGTYELTDKRKGKLLNELADLEEAEQYALRAIRGGMYPCFSCLFSDSIFLYSGEIWKYGITTKGQNRRYGRFLINMGLQYEIQYKGLLHDCLKEEKRKIYNYPLLPENLKRINKLGRPPGNKQDS
ncbi:MAG: hypothetical protein ACPGVB_07565 [Chitinophagales bacterium]